MNKISPEIPPAIVFTLQNKVAQFFQENDDVLLDYETFREMFEESFDEHNVDLHEHNDNAVRLTQNVDYMMVITNDTPDGFDFDLYNADGSRYEGDVEGVIWVEHEAALQVGCQCIVRLMERIAHVIRVLPSDKMLCRA
jgi:hypothetical protein